jgi:Flp pilus assembly protein TadG
MTRLQKSRVELHRRGTAAIEYALILPVMLLIVFGLMDIGRLLWTYTTLSRAVEAAARCAAINTAECGTSAQIRSRAVTEAWGLSVTSATFTVTTPSCGVQVRASYDFKFIIPMLDAVTPLGTITLEPTACYPV